MANTTNLQMPRMEANQNQKHVTHNEALDILDTLVNLAVIDRDLTAPPGSPSDGDRYIIDSPATGAWTGNEGKVAAYLDGAWEIFAPKEGWTAWVNDENVLIIYDGSDWIPYATAILLGWGGGSLTMLGVNTTADTTNRLSVRSNGALFTTVSGDMAFTLNKLLSSDDAGFYFQQGFDTYALFGLMGSNDFTFKTSDGAGNFFDGLIIRSDDGRVDIVQNAKASAYLNFGQTYTAGSWTDLLMNNTRHNDQSAAAISGGNVLTFTAPVDGYYMCGVGATYETTGGTAPTKMSVGISVNGSTPTGDRIGVAGDATITDGETQAQVSALIKLSAGDTLAPKVNFVTNNGRVLADNNYFWAARVA